MFVFIHFSLLSVNCAIFSAHCFYTKYELTAAYTGNLYKAVPRLGECCRQVDAEEVSNSRNKFTKPGNGIIEIPCSDCVKTSQMDAESKIYGT